MEGWIKLHRKILDSKYGKNLELRGLFDSLLLMANHKEGFTADGTKVSPGQFMTSKLILSKEFRVSEMKMHRLLNKLQSVGQIVAQSSRKNTIITITNWHSYQVDEVQNDAQVMINRGPSDDQVMTNKNAKNVKNEKNERTNIINCEAFTGEQNLDEVPVTELAKNILTALNTLCFKSFRPSAANMKFINARIKENYNLEDFVAVIKSKQASWGNNPEMSGYLRPSTLFGTKFDGYLQETKNALKTNSRHQSNDITEDDLIEAKKLGIL